MWRKKRKGKEKESKEKTKLINNGLLHILCLDYVDIFKYPNVTKMLKQRMLK